MNYMESGLKIMKKISEIINEWDRIDLFPLAPIDEYTREIEMVEKIFSITPNITPEKLGTEIHNIFVRRFGEDVFTKNLRECDAIAIKIINNL